VRGTNLRGVWHRKLTKRSPPRRRARVGSVTVSGGGVGGGRRWAVHVEVARGSSAEERQRQWRSTVAVAAGSRVGEQCLVVGVPFAMTVRSIRGQGGRSTMGCPGGGRNLAPTSRTPCGGRRLDEEGTAGGGGGRRRCNSGEAARGDGQRRHEEATLLTGETTPGNALCGKERSNVGKPSSL
jgi:hypothetical protein